MKTIGTIIKTYGFEGAVVVRSEGGIPREPVKGEPVFIVIDGIPVPFFTREAFSPSPETLVISFDDCHTEESVMSFKGCEVRISGCENNDEGTDYTGFTVRDNASAFTGIITAMIANPGQILARVNSEQGEVLIPMHTDLIIKTDRKHRLIIMSLPEGLIGINR